jgi:hypothetical protein
MKECNVYNSYMENDVLSLWRIKKENENNRIDYEIGDGKTMKKLEKRSFYLNWLRHQNYGKDWVIVLTHQLIIKYLHHYKVKMWWQQHKLLW